MILSQLRRKHPRFIYQDFEVKPDGKHLRVSFNFLLTPDIRFQSEVSIPLPSTHQDIPMEMIFNLGMIEAISYWKAACPPELIVKAGYLSLDQIAWWKHLFIHGLGEFFYRNKIDFTPSDFLTIATGPSSRVSVANREIQRSDQDGDLILVGGGKDSIVTLESLKNLPGKKTAMMVNPGPNSLAAARIAGCKNPIIVTRTIDPRLLQLNKLGYLNGHTPFSAYLAFLGVLVAHLHGYKNVISSNELGAGEASLIYKSMEINHQYSKSFGFEKMFRDYVSNYLSNSFQTGRRAGRENFFVELARADDSSRPINYFSFLRPLYELQIAKLFASLPASPKYDSAFVSCNLGRGKFWCGHCPKCAFNYLSLFSFMPSERMKNIFKSDLFDNSEIQKHILDLVGLGQCKPFDCVGTQDESILAMALAISKIRKRQATSNRRQDFLLKLQQRLHLDDQEFVAKLEKKILNNWSNQNFLPSDYSRVLKQLTNRH